MISLPHENTIITSAGRAGKQEAVITAKRLFWCLEKPRMRHNLKGKLKSMAASFAR